MEQKQLTITIQKFEGTNAVCTLGDTHYVLQLPINNLPSEINTGTELIINVMKAEDSQINFAYQTLAAMLN